ncbi:MAG: EamA family transporter, partial [Calditrichae bacterium]|nr:EamA family transporter [Calditrichia bacterium]
MRTFILLLLIMIWGTTWIAIKFSLMGIPPFLGAMLRFSVAVLLLFIFARLKKIPLIFPKNKFKYIFICALFLYFFDYGFIYWGEQYLNAGVTAIFFSTFPIFTGLVSTFVFKSDPFRWNKFVGLLMGFTGITTIFNEQLLMTDFEGMVIWASLAVVFSAFSAAISLTMVKKYLTEVHTVPLTLYQMIVGVIILGVIALVRGEANQVSLTLPVIAAVIYLGGIGSALAFGLYYSLLKKMSPISLSYIIYITPLVAIFSGWLILGETVTVN